jgi:5-methylcytosine-specific restriction protein B
VNYNWQCANSRAQPGDTAWIIRYGVGVEPKGIVARGAITSQPYPDHHPVFPEKMTPHVRVKIEEIRPEGDLLPLSVLEKECADQKWNPRNSGILLKPNAVRCVERLW